MQLLVHITSHADSVTPILKMFKEKGLSGATVIDCKGMYKTLNEQGVEPPPIFGSVRRFVNPDQETNKLILVVLKDEDVPVAKDVIHHVAGNLKAPDTGILFTLPIMGWEGVSHK